MSGIQEEVQIGQCRVLRGNCREILPALPPALIVTDMPYGTGWVRGGGKRAGTFHARYTKAAWDQFALDWLPSPVPGFAIFGPASREADLRALGGSLVWWEKTNPRPGGPRREPIAIFPSQPEQVFRAYNGDTPLHPCQKPLTLMRWLLRLLPPFPLVIDPFMGSGMTGCACLDMGCPFIGIEIDRAVFQVACSQIAEHAQQLPLFPSLLRSVA